MSASTKIIFTLAWLALFGSAIAQEQNFAGLGAANDGFAEVSRETVLEFPRDHGPHPDYRIEWWYVTANLKGEDGNEYGAQWTLFRQALSPPPQRNSWESQQIWLGHAALTSIDQHYVAETVGRSAAGQSGVDTDPFEAWIDDWSFRSKADTDIDWFAEAELKARGNNFSYRFDLEANGPLVLHGINGFSQKAASGQASHYYSQPYYSLRGEIVIESRTIAVTGTAWLDREWSSQLLGESQTGWDWFSLQLDRGDRLMLFRLRDELAGDYFSGTWITAEGQANPLGEHEISMEPLREMKVADRDIPIEWRLQIAKHGLDIETTPLNPHSWMKTSIPYWEGPIRFSGSHNGIGYLEMTGYLPK